ncbi:LADA_0G02520g1_1 [Lachancea dasiensis]|uniref:AP-3 complex subunit delta n=1 Tax=Lachancea dasiensis TaxID=1072105 RepID=A0A1G4JR91_9SACH|nr:LADA_0G02520g1_1 [Lachancea dasiensis]
MTSLYAPSADDVMRRLRPFGLFFEKSLKDLIKAIRSAGENPEELQLVLNKALSESREEVGSPDLNLKANAVVKLTYLEMYGFDMSWANFHVLEVMSSSKLQHKRVGYLAASQSFYKDSDVLMLATNLLKKDLKYDGSNDILKMGVTLSGLSTMVTTPLASDICDDLFSMLGSSKPYIRKKAVAALFKVFLQYPEALRDNFDKFVSKLEDEDLSVVSATVSVICELSKKNPLPFIALSPLLYEMLLTVDNNWIIIRLLKLFTNLSQVEPKLRVKILPKVLELMEVTSATSVIYESINCIVKGQMLEEDDFDTASSCLQELNKFCNSTDPNLRYISVVLFYKIGKINAEFINEFNTLVIRLLKDVDISIRSRALELLEGATNDENITSIVQILIKQFIDKDMVSATNLFRQPGSGGVEIEIPLSYKLKMVSTILKICSMKSYANIPDFDWYIAVLSDLCVLSQDLNSSNLGHELADEIRNIMVKVPSMRPKFISAIITLVVNKDICQQMPMILREGFWCIGEFSALLQDGNHLIKEFVKQKRLPPDVQQVLAQALLKIFSNWCNTSGDIIYAEVKDTLKELVKFYEGFSTSPSFEVQERSVEFLEFCRLCEESLDQQEEEEGLPLLLTEVLPSFFDAYDLNPIVLGTQKKLQSSFTLDLETPFMTEEEIEALLAEAAGKNEENSGLISDIDSRLDSDEDDSLTSYMQPLARELGSEVKMSAEEREYSEAKRKQERMDNPFYLETGEPEIIKNASPLLDFDDDAKLSVVKSFSELHLPYTGPKDSDETKKKRKKKKNSRSKAQVLTEEGLPDLPRDAELTKESHDRIDNAISTENSNAINLRMQSKLENFDFSPPSLTSDGQSENISEHQPELEKLRAKFATNSRMDDPPEEEVVVVSKKKNPSPNPSQSLSRARKKRRATLKLKLMKRAKRVTAFSHKMFFAL